MRLNFMSFIQNPDTERQERADLGYTPGDNININLNPFPHSSQSHSYR